MALLAAVALGVWAQEPQAYLKVIRVSTSRGSQVVAPSWGTHARDYTRSVSISIQVRGMGAAGRATLEWFFLAKSNRSGQLWIFDEGREPIELESAKLIEVQKTSKELAASVSEYGTWMRVEGGSRVEGYVVRITSGHRVVAVSASAKTLELLARDPVKWAALLETSEKIRSEKEHRNREETSPAPPP